ncbi:MAG: FecR domain-containing protein, partial [Puniceicoccales bacterium]
MKITPLLTVFHLLPLSLLLGEEPYANLTESTIVETINQVDILSGEELDPHPAESGDLFKFPDFLQTGRGSRARLEAKDGTITRVGSNTLFSFEGDQRTINLDRGSLLFHSPEGRGGGRIVTASATASVVGTTIIVAATANGGFKVLVLEGVAKVTYPDNTTRFLKAGQMTFVVPANAESGGGSGKGPVLNFDLEALNESSKLVKGFDSPLPSEGKIDFAITTQNREIEDGELRETNTFILHSDGDDVIGLDLNNLNELTEAAQQSRRAANLLQQLEDTGGTPSFGSDSSTPEEIPDTGTTITELARLLAAADSTVTVTETFPSENFFAWPGVTIPEGTFEKQPENNQAMGFIAGNLILPGSSLDIEPITLFPTGEDPQVILFSLNSLDIGGDLTFGGFNQDSQFFLESEGTLNIAGESFLELPGTETGQSPSIDVSANENGTSISATNTGSVDWNIASNDSLDLNTVSISNSTTDGNLQVESRSGNLTV